MALFYTFSQFLTKTRSAPVAQRLRAACARRKPLFFLLAHGRERAALGQQTLAQTLVHSARGAERRSAPRALWRRQRESEHPGRVSAGRYSHVDVTCGHT